MTEKSMRQSIYWTPELLAKIDEALEGRDLSRSRLVRACVEYVLDHKFLDHALRNGDKHEDRN